ncbi:4-oxalocrotonate decarboxylase [Streptomyces sp. NRRL F-4489]|uniref:2-keto-4-pentenoate hydratase n=1 Tax=Streptomyces sp. NRRL F-4489 TaxID=1609095 RepID=UPI0007469FC3|nr:fumarylacetoacetate hydrolase family protein [Streptomyces sp. NRRL F-4489]KUL45995.1 4-oxalocrotonate decarboxylase [Streptomyces sp. NRRL F-4489]
MTGPTTDILAAARALDQAALDGRPVPQLTDTAPLDVATAYAVQRALLERRLARGERPAGVKMGFTSAAKMRQMGVGDVIWGRLTDAMRIADGATLDLSGFVHPRVEPEVAFLLGRPLAGAVSGAEAARAVAAVAPAYEVIDSRYEGFRFSLPDVIADNTSAAAFGVGLWRDTDRFDPVAGLANLGMALEVDGRPAETGSSAAILGHPLRSLVAAARLAADAGLVLEAGWIVLAGAATAAVPLEPGRHLRVTAGALGRVEVTTGRAAPAAKGER